MRVMPVCVGRPDSGCCPNNANDDSVNCQNVCDLYLCKACYDYRVSSVSTKPATAEAVPLAAQTFVVNELLCYLQQKGKILPFDDLVRLCADFITMEEIENARLVLIKYASKSRLGKLKGSDVATRSVAALLKVCLDTSVKLPQFTALNLARLPPVGVEHVDVSALMQEIVALRQEVRAVAILRAEMHELRNCVQQLTKRNVCPAPATGQLVVQATARNVQLANENATPVLSTDCNGNNFSPADRQLKPTTAEVVSHAVQTGALARAAAQKKAAQGSKMIVGRSTHANQLKAARSKSRVDIFVSRLDPECTTDDVKACLLANDKASTASDIFIEKLNTKFDTYSSYHVSVLVDSSIKLSLIDSFMNSENWPNGILVRRFFKNRHG